MVYIAFGDLIEKFLKEELNLCKKRALSLPGKILDQKDFKKNVKYFNSVADS